MNTDISIFTMKANTCNPQAAYNKLYMILFKNIKFLIENVYIMQVAKL